MKNINSAKKIGTSLLLTLALIALTYLLLPKGHSVGAAPQMPQGVSSQKAMAASIRAEQKSARMALGQLPLSFEINRGQLVARVD